MSVARSAATATLLDGAPCEGASAPGWCGKVLVVGGQSSSGYLDSAELYDPQTRTWKPTGGTRDVRWLHKAVALPSGKVLVIGGAIAGQTAEIYDPETGRWTPTAPTLVGGLRDFTATGLVDGRVLVVGGQIYPAGTNDVQVYDPRDDKWALTTPTTVGRYNPVSVRLADGKVLVAGGSPGTPTAEIYDPVLMTWTPTGPLVSPFALSCEGPPCNTATLLDNGEVLVTGGDIVDGGLEDEAPVPDARRNSQLFNPATLQWRAGPQMHQPRMKSTATKLADGRVLLAGGAEGSPGSANGGDGVTDPAEIYDPESNSWIVTGSFVEGRGLHDAVLLGGSRCGGVDKPSWCGQVMAVGGSNPRGRIGAVELFEAGEQGRQPSILGVTPRSGPVAGGTEVTITGAGLGSVDQVDFGTVSAPVVRHDPASPDTKITVVTPGMAPGQVDISVTTSGGQKSRFVSQASFTFYPSGEWKQSDAPAGTGSTATLLTGPGCAQVCGRVLVSGGPNGEAWLYDPINGWDETGSLGGPRFHHTQTVLDDGRVLVVGGQTGPDYVAPTAQSAAVYEPDTGAWTAIDGPNIPRRDHTTTRLSSGHVLVAGGLDRGTSGPIGGVGVGGEPAEAHRISEIYNPSTNSWSVAGALSTGRFDHSGVLLAGPECHQASAPAYCGKVLVAGGQDTAFARLRSAELYDPGSGTWAPTGELAEARVGHTMTDVPQPACGSSGTSAPCTGVMVTGGYGGPRQSTEIYDPIAGVWRPSSSMNVGRFGHTATRLANGTLLVAGGESSAGPSDTVEVFDPIVGSWTLTGPMASPRSEHFSLGLPDGRVLVGGGCCAQSAELYESARTKVTASIASLQPASGSTLGGTRVSIQGRGLTGASVDVRFDNSPVEITFKSDSRIDVTAPPHRQGEVAVRVAVTGPAGETEIAGPLEFTYGSGTWRYGDAAGSCSGCQGRYLHTATPLADGKVLVAGGTLNYLLFFTDPGAADGALRSAQILDPVTGRWSATQPMATGRFSHSATTIGDGTILVAGGQDANGTAIRSSELYDPKTQTWTEAGLLSTARFSHTATVLADGRVLVVGGAPTEERRDTPLPTSEIYNPATKQWSPTGSLDTARENHSATLLPDGKVLVAGGIGHSSSEGDVPDVPPTLGPGFPPSLGAASHAVALNSTEIFDPSSGSWAKGPSMAVERFGHSATVLAGHACSAAGTAVCGRILVAGGSRGGPGGTTSSEVYDPNKREWSPASNLRTPRAGHAATLLADGTVLVAGGGPAFPGQEAPGPLATAEIFDPAIGWRYTGSLGVPRAGLTLSAIPGGDVVAVGGYQAQQGSHFPTEFTVTLSEPTEIYRAAPRIFGVSPAMAPVNGEAPVHITGTGLASADRVLFGDVAAAGFDRVASDRVAAVPPRQPVGPVEVAAVNSGGTSARTPPNPAAMFRYVMGPGQVIDLKAVALSESEVQLSFTTPDDGTGAGRATRYVVKQAAASITSDATFDAATTVLGPDRVFDQATTIQLRVGDLEQGTTYHYAVKALDTLGAIGRLSNPATATTYGSRGVGGVAGCPRLNPGGGELFYPSGYSLVGLPGGTQVAGVGALFSWFQQGAGGVYATHGPSTSLEAGHGYWAYFGCASVVPLAGGQSDVSFPLDRYNASMVGNPSLNRATVTGHDFGARWDPATSSYSLSGYRESLPLAAGEGAWAFSYVRTDIHIRAER